MAVEYLRVWQSTRAFYSSPRQFLYTLYTHDWELINIEPLEVIVGPKIKSETKLMAIEQFISETMCIQ
jgi:hypothetical protein